MTNETVRVNQATNEVRIKTLEDTNKVLWEKLDAISSDYVSKKAITWILGALVGLLMVAETFASDCEVGKVLVSFGTPAGNVEPAGYLLYVGDSPATLKFRADLPSPLSEYLVVQPDPGVRYYGVVAYDKSGGKSEMAAAGSVVLNKYTTVKRSAWRGIPGAPFKDINTGEFIQFIPVGLQCGQVISKDRTGNVYRLIEYQGRWGKTLCSEAL